MGFCKGLIMGLGSLLMIPGIDAAVAPVITSQPSSMQVAETNTATFTVVATGTSLSYQWQKSDNAGVDWANISGATSSSYTTAATVRSSDNNDQYRCVVSNSVGSETTNAATLTVWNPTLLTGLQLWLDGADPATILEGAADAAEDGDVVAQWSDKSGNARHATASTTARPTYRATGTNSKGVLEFNGSTNVMSVGTTGTFNFLHNGTDSLVVVVVKLGTTSNPDAIYGLLANNGNASANIGYLLAYDDRSSQSRTDAFFSMVCRGVSGAQAMFNVQNDSIPPNQYCIITDRIRANDGAAFVRSLGRVNTGQNGTSYVIAENIETPAVSASNHTYVTKIGNDGNVGGYLNGSIAEVIVCNNPNLSLNVDLVDYLGSKWGIETDLLTFSTAQRISAATSSYDAFPTISTTDGELICLFRSASSHVGTKGTISMAKSLDDGATWSVTANVISHATLDLRDPQQIVLSNGDIVVLSNIYNHATSTAGPTGVFRSTDNGTTFTQITTINARSGYTFLFPFGFPRLKEGVIYGVFYENKASDSTQYPCIFSSADDGATWSFLSQLSVGYNETSIINTGGSNWLAISRPANEAVNTMAWFTSSDNMATWSSATLTNFGTQAVSPCLVEWNGDIWLFTGDRSGTDGIKAWKWTGSGFLGNGFIYIASGTDCGYPSAVVDADNALQLVFYQQYTSPGVMHYKITNQ